MKVSARNVLPGTVKLYAITKTPNVMIGID